MQVIFLQPMQIQKFLLHGYEEWGTELLQKYVGCLLLRFGIMRKKELFGARDHFGIKPYYHAEMNGTFDVWF